MRKTLLIFFVLSFFLLAGNTQAQTTSSFIFGGINRSYIVFVPSNWTPEKHYPMLIAMHGLTQTGNSMMNFSGFNTYAEEYGFIVVYPNGVLNSWNVGFPGGSTADDVGFISALIDTVHSDYSVDLNRVYATGFSNGGFMSYRLACELGDRIAAIASVAGTMTDGSLTGCQPLRNIPVMHIHGTNDMVVFYNGGFGNASVNSVLAFWRGADECPAVPTIVNLPDLVIEGSTVQQQTWTPCSDSTEVTFYKITGGGHTWPGSIGTTGSGNTNRDIIASDEIWKFVSRFSLPQVNTSIHNIKQQSFTVFPNPATTDLVSLSMAPSAFVARLEVFSADGQKIKELSIPSNTTTLAIGLQNISKGLCILRLITPYEVQSVKLIVQ